MRNQAKFRSRTVRNLVNGTRAAAPGLTSGIPEQSERTNEDFKRSPFDFQPLTPASFAHSLAPVRVHLHSLAVHNFREKMLANLWILSLPPVSYGRLGSHVAFGFSPSPSLRIRVYPCPSVVYSRSAVKNDL